MLLSQSLCSKFLLLEVGPMDKQCPPPWELARKAEPTKPELAFYQDLQTTRAHQGW